MLIVAAVILAAATSAVAQSARRPARVLLLYQQLAETPQMVEFTLRLRSALSRALTSPVEFYQESLDLDRFAGEERWAPLQSYLDTKYRDIGIDVIVPIGTRALTFAENRLRATLPDAPIVFALASAPQTNPATLPPNTTGRLATALRFNSTLAMARALQPDAESIVVVGGASATDSLTVAAALDATREVGGGVPVTVLAGLPLDTLLKRLHRVPERSIVIFANFRLDATGQIFEPVDLVGTMARASSAPMYAQLRNFVGEGIVGGSAMSFGDEGEKTGLMIARTLRRRRGEPLPPAELIGASYVADARQLKRWDLSERRLPPGTQVLFREPSLWARYRTEVLITLGVMTVQLALIALLLVERRRRKRAQLAVEDQAAYEQTMARVRTDAVRHAPDEAPQALENALARIAEYAGASSATLVQSADSNGGAPVRLRWDAPSGLEPSDTPSSEGDGSRLEIPLVADGASIGALDLWRHDGREWPETLVRRIESAGEIIAGAMARSRAVHAVRRGEELNRAVLASISTQIAILDGTGTIIRANEAWRRVATHASGAAATDAFVGANYLDECRRAELRGCDQAADVRRGIENVLERRAWPFRYEYRSEEPWERWYELFVDRLQLSDGGAIVTHFDITDRRLAERRVEETRRQVAHMGRIALVGELAATMSHELRQPLAAIRVNAEAGAQLLAAEPADVEEARQIFQNIVSDDARAVELIEGVRKLLRKEESLTATVDLNQICRDAGRLLQHDAALRATRLELVLDANAPLVTGDPVQLQQVVLNLALNGIEAASGGSPERVVTVATSRGENQAEVLVHDTGRGIPPGVQPHLFESFFSTKSGGLGLGLAIVRSIVERHNGRVHVENSPSGGAVFRVCLPLASGTRSVPVGTYRRSKGSILAARDGKGRQ
jgi:signal transduction histidine kinase